MVREQAEQPEVERRSATIAFLGTSLANATTARSVLQGLSRGGTMFGTRAYSAAAIFSVSLVAGIAGAMAVRDPLFTGALGESSRWQLVCNAGAKAHFISLSEPGERLAIEIARRGQTPHDVDLLTSEPEFANRLAAMAAGQRIRIRYHVWSERERILEGFLGDELGPQIAAIFSERVAAGRWEAREHLFTTTAELPMPRLGFACGGEVGRLRFADLQVEPVEVEPSRD